MTTPDASGGGAARRLSLGWLRGGFAPMSAITIVAIASGLSHPLLALFLEDWGESGVRIGISAAAASVGIILGGPICLRLMNALGAARFLALGMAVCALIFIGFKLFENYWAWLALRGLLGLTVGGLFLGSEYWIMTNAPPAMRGRVIAVYAMMLSAGFAIGPLVLLAAGSSGWAPFVAAALICCVAIAPVAISWRGAPPKAPKPEKTRTLRYFATDPSLLFGVLLFGAVEFGAIALIPVWGVRLGMSETMAIALLVAVAGGGVICQPFLGWAADKYPVRPLLLITAFSCVGGAAAMWLMWDAPSFLFPALIAFGGLSAGLYTVSLTEIGARYEGQELAAANAAVVAAYGLGAFLGPPLIGGAMDVLGPDGLPAVLASMAAVYAMLVLFRLRAS